MSRQLRNIFSFVFALIISAATCSSAKAADIAVSVDPQSGTTDDTFVYQVLVRGTEISGFGRPVIAESTDFDIDFASTKLSHFLVNGSLVNSVVYMYRVQPKDELKPGSYTLPGGYFERGAKRDEFDGPTIVIVKGGTTKARTDLGVDFAQIVDQTEPYVGQQITYRAEIASRNNVLQATLSEIEFDGFFRESYGKKREEMRNVSPDTRVYSVREALFPTNPGPVAIPKRSLTAVISVLNKRSRAGGGSWDPFFGALPDLLEFSGDYDQIEKKFSASGIALNVKPLPPPPPGAQSYIPVGSISVASSTDKKLIKQGEGCSYQVELYGDANLRPLELTPSDSPNFRIFPDKPEVQTFIEDGRIKFRKRFSFAVIPLMSGKVELPSFSIVTFDPSTKEYKTISTPSRIVSVIPSDGNPATPPSALSQAPRTSAGGASTADAVADLRPQYAALHHQEQRLSLRFYLAALLLVPLFSLLFLFYGERVQRLLADPALLAKRSALPKALSKLAALERSSEAEQIQILLSTLKSFIGDKTGRRGESLTPTEARDILQQTKLSEALSSEVFNLLSRLEGLIYSGIPEQARAEELKLITDQVKKTVTQIDQETQA